MSTDRSSARCSFCGRHSSEVQHMIAGPGAAYICDACLQLCNDILMDATPFSTKALELASRPPIVVAAPNIQERLTPPIQPREPLRTLTLEMEQKQYDMTLILHQIRFYQEHFELRYLWMASAVSCGFCLCATYHFLFAGLRGNAMERGARWYAACTPRTGKWASQCSVSRDGTFSAIAFTRSTRAHNTRRGPTCSI